MPNLSETRRHILKGLFTGATLRRLSRGTKWSLSAGPLPTDGYNMKCQDGIVQSLADEGFVTLESFEEFITDLGRKAVSS